MEITHLFLLVLIGLIVLLAGVFLILEFSVTIAGHFFGAPFVKSRKERIETMLELAELKPGTKVVDLGSGDGALLIAAAHAGASAIGVEINPFLIWYSRWRIRRAGLEKQANVVWDNFKKYPLAEADVIFLYLWPETIEKLKEKLIKELRPDIKIVSNGFAISGWTPKQQKNNVFLYEITGPVNTNN